MRKWYEFTDYISPDGKTYHFRTHEKFLISEAGYGMPDIQYISQKGPMQHGETVYDYRLQPRVIQMEIQRENCSREEYWASRANILNFLRPNRQTSTTFTLGTLVKRFSDGTKRAIKVVPQEGPSFEKSGGKEWREYSFQDTLRFYAPDPTFYDPTINTSAWTLNPSVVARLIFPFTFDGTDMQFFIPFINDSDTVNYTGTWMSFPTIVIQGPLSGTRITNTSTGEFILVNFPILTGDTVTIQLEYGNKTITSSTYGNIIGSVDPTCDFATFHIAPDPEVSGGVNNFTVLGQDASLATSITMSWYTRYIGI